MQNKDVLIDFNSIEKNLEHVNLVTQKVHPIPLEKIVGSLGRYQDFTEEFLPKKQQKSAKYESVKRAVLSGKLLPPIKVYKILDNYFVIDGHHRVTVAKNELKAIDIDAEVIEVNFDLPIHTDRAYTYNTEQAKDFLIVIEEDAFQKKTGLRNRILKYPLKVTELNSYARVYEEILDFRKTHENGRYFKKEMVHASYEWYEKRFLPSINIIIEENVLDEFPRRTYTDLYVWLQRHKYFLSQKAGYDVGFDYTVDDFVHTYRKANVLELIPQVTKDIVRVIKKEIKGKLLNT